MVVPNEWLLPRGSRRRDGWSAVVDGTVPGWAHSGIRVGELAAGPLTVPGDRAERIVVPLEGSCTVTSGRTTYPLRGRRSVFEGPTDVLYLGVGTPATISGSGRVAVAEAPATVAHPVALLRAEEVPVEIRGAARSSRQVHNFGTPQGLRAEKLIVCEVITPAGNWSSYPPHKHDEAADDETRLEEIYYFESAVTRGADAPGTADPFGLFTSYPSPAGEIETLARVRTGDIALVPFGYHGPAAAAPGYDLYYLNVMAGPDPERAWRITDDPAHAWIRETWRDQDTDPRLPYEPRSAR